MRRRRERGAAILYVVAATGAAGLLVVANLGVADSARRSAARIEAALRARYAREATAEVFSARAAGGGNATDPIAFTLAGESVTATINAIPWLTVSVTTQVGGSSYVDAVRDPRGYTPFLYALYAQNSIKSNSNITVQCPTAPGSAYIAGNMPNNATVSVDGAVDAEKNLNKGDFASVIGPIRTGLNSPNLPNRRMILLPDEPYILPVTINGRGTTAFPPRTIQSSAEVTVTGNFAGDTVITSSRLIHLVPPITTSNGAKVVIVSDNGIDVDGNGGVGAFLYAANGFDAKNATVDVYGAVAAKDVTAKGALRIVYDDLFWDDMAKANAMLVPSLGPPAP